MKNIAEILKNCPEGTKLYSLVHGEVELTRVGVEDIYCKPSYLNCELSFCSDGRLVENEGECILFPSKENRDWDKFIPFKDGDIIYTCCKGAHTFISIFKEIKNEQIFTYCDLGWLLYMPESKTNVCCKVTSIKEQRFATEEEKKKLFDAIKANGYRWNPETKTLEKLIEPKFKVGDKIKLKNTPTNSILTVTKTNDDGSLNVNMYSWVIEYELQDEYELVINNQPKFKVGDKIKKKGDTRLITIKDVRDSYYIITIPDYFDNCYITDKLSFSNQGDYELLPNKFDITTLKPFDKVLVRDSNKAQWAITFFSHCNNLEIYKYSCINNTGYVQCIPYEGNEYLLDTANECDEYYKTWE